MRYLVDANVLSEPTRPVPDQRAVAWLGAREGDLVAAPPVLGEMSARHPRASTRQEARASRGLVRGRGSGDRLRALGCGGRLTVGTAGDGPEEEGARDAAPGFADRRNSLALRLHGRHAKRAALCVGRRRRRRPVRLTLDRRPTRQSTAPSGSGCARPARGRTPVPRGCAALPYLRPATGLGGNVEGRPEIASRQALQRFPGRGVDDLDGGRQSRRPGEVRQASSDRALDVRPEVVDDDDGIRASAIARLFVFPAAGNDWA